METGAAVAALCQDADGDAVASASGLETRSPSPLPSGSKDPTRALGVLASLLALDVLFDDEGAHMMDRTTR